MLNQKYFGLPLWVWIIVLSILVFSCYKTSNSVSKTETVSEKKEGFAEVKAQVETKSESGKKQVIVYNFNTEWCGWSKRFQPEWDKFSQMTQSEPKLAHIRAMDIKCDKAENESMCEKYDVPGFPYVMIEVQGKRIAYSGERTAEALVEFCSNL